MDVVRTRLYSQKHNSSYPDSLEGVESEHRQNLAPLVIEAVVGSSLQNAEEEKP